MPREAIVLAAHGSRDPRSAATVREIARAVAAARPDYDVQCAFLDFESPGLGEVLDAAATANQRCVVAPLLLTPAYHARVDIPAIVAAARSRGADVDIVDALGGDALGAELLAAALHSRLPDRGDTGAGTDAIVVAAAGSRDPSALAIVDQVAAVLERHVGVPCRAGYASGAGPSVRETVLALRAGGAADIALAMYFVAPGVLPERAMAQATDLGVTEIGAPIGAAGRLVDLVGARVDASALVLSR